MPLPERKLIDRIRAQAAAHARHLTRGIGDDCALLRPPRGHEILVTTDFSLEDVHFRRAWHSPESVGHRCLARGLSDIAAMGGQPLAAFLSLALPAGLPQRWADAFLRGLLGLARKFNTPLAGGDTAQSPGGVFADIIVVGSVPNGKAILRSGARAGDRIYVTGTLGGSAATIALLKRGRKLRERDYPQHFAPTPRIEVARILRRSRIPTAMIDLSDGISVDLTHLCQESNLRAVIDAASIPLAKIGRPARPVPLEYALHGGEDYELLFTAPFNKRVPRSIAGVPVTEIGAMVKMYPDQDRILLMTAGVPAPLAPRGWEHFREQT